LLGDRAVDVVDRCQYLLFVKRPEDGTVESDRPARAQPGANIADSAAPYERGLVRSITHGATKLTPITHGATKLTRVGAIRRPGLHEPILATTTRAPSDHWHHSSNVPS
jgi:hypothetical protein